MNRVWRRSLPHSLSLSITSYIERNTARELNTHSARHTNSDARLSNLRVRARVSWISIKNLITCRRCGNRSRRNAANKSRDENVRHARACGRCAIHNRAMEDLTEYLYFALLTRVSVRVTTSRFARRGSLLFPARLFARRRNARRPSFIFRERHGERRIIGVACSARKRNLLIRSTE